MGCHADGMDHSLEFGAQGGVGFLVDGQVQLQPIFQPARVVVIGRNLVEAQLLDDVRAYPLGGVNRAFLSIVPFF